MKDWNFRSEIDQKNETNECRDNPFSRTLRGIDRMQTFHSYLITLLSVICALFIINTPINTTYPQLKFELVDLIPLFLGSGLSVGLIWHCFPKKKLKPFMTSLTYLYLGIGMYREFAFYSFYAKTNLYIRCKIIDYIDLLLLTLLLGIQWFFVDEDEKKKSSNVNFVC